MVDRQRLSDADFELSLRNAFTAQLLCANTCSREGAVEVHPACLRIRPTFGERRDYRDDGGLDVKWHRGGRLWKYEVKWRRKLRFNSVAGFRYPTIYVDECYNLDMKDPRPDAYFICNRDLTAALVVPLDVPMRKVPHSDDRYHQTITSYEVDRECATILKLQWI